jgi:alkyl sulfatase BDS1-like metallo-beta-lactamase superfamily hydrolase
MPYAFLSDEWMDAAREIRERYADQSPTIPATVRANMIVNEVPFGDGAVNAHLDTSSGKMAMELGHLDGADATLTMDYATAKSFVVTQDQAAIMQAFMGGKIKIQGDMTKLMALAAVSQSAGPEAVAAAAKVSEELKGITE